MSDSLWIWSLWLMVIAELGFGVYMVVTDKEKSS
jgi:hypothetical protein